MSLCFVFSQDPAPSGGSLLQGEYNEAESAASFAAALAEWRNSKKKDGGNQKIEIVHGDKTVMSHQSKPEGRSTSWFHGWYLR